MKIKSIHVFLASLLFGATLCNEQNNPASESKSNNEDQTEIVEVDACFYPGEAEYIYKKSGYAWVSTKNNQVSDLFYYNERGERIENNVLLARLQIKYKDFDKYSNNRHPVFEKKDISFSWQFPLTYLKDKKEGDIIQFVLYKKDNDKIICSFKDDPSITDKIVVKLRLQQKESDYAHCGKGNFEECLASHVKDSIRQRKYLIKDLQRNYYQQKDKE